MVPIICHKLSAIREIRAPRLWIFLSSLQEAFFSKASKRPLSPAMRLALCSRVVNRHRLEQGRVPIVPPLRSVPIVPIVYGTGGSINKLDRLEPLERLELLERLKRASVIIRFSAVAPSVKRARWYPTFGGGAPRDRSPPRRSSRCVSLRQT